MDDAEKRQKIDIEALRKATTVVGAWCRDRSMEVTQLLGAIEGATALRDAGNIISENAEIFAEAQAKAAAALRQLESDKQQFETGAIAKRRAYAEAVNNLQQRQAEHAALIDEMDAQIKAKQEKLSALKAAINEKAAILGGLIAKELTQ